jgi:hypothetical protein
MFMLRNIQDIWIQNTQLLTVKPGVHVVSTGYKSAKVPKTYIFFNISVYIKLTDF